MRNKRGFTFVEVVIVLTILAILAAIAIPNFIAMQNRAKETQTKDNALRIEFAAHGYAGMHDGCYPPNELFLIEGDSIDKKYLNAFTGNLTEPSNGSSKGCIGYIGSEDGSSYLIYAIGAKRDTIIKLEPPSKPDTLKLGPVIF